MGRVVITTKRCPCCKYEYQKTEYYKMIEEMEEKQVPKVKNGKPIKLTIEEQFAVAMDPYGEIAQKKMKWKKVPTQVEKFDREEITKGKEDFIPIEVVTEMFNTTTIGMECPNCGIHMSINKCTTREEKNI